MSERIFENLQKFLSENGAKFRVLAHKAAGSSAEAAIARGTELGQGAKALVCVVKGVEDKFEPNCPVPENLRILNDKGLAQKAGKIYVLAVIPADLEVSLEALANTFGGKKASLASPAEVNALCDCVFGSIPPFSFHEKLLLVADENLFKRYEEIAFNAGLLDRSIILDIKDYEHIAKAKVMKLAKLV